MATKTLHIPGFGDFPYDDSLDPQGFETDGVLKTTRTPTGAGEVVRYEDIGSGGLAAPIGSAYVVVALDGDLTNERRLQVDSGLTLNDGGAGGDITIGYNAEPDVGALTDNSGGTPDGTVQALTDPADAPVVADVLRDDLVANLIPELRNNLAELTDKINSIRTVLQNLGITA